ncbi:MAG: sulfatase-like hydrolase/transferase [Acidobacteria bacterium]|nr:sulfatase-like hydrolase/transferase [Acidobacteriota bacterium]
MATTAPNIVFILTDQERFFPELPSGFDIPGRHRLQDLGVTFTNHQITSCVCTPSRSTIYTGQHIQRTGVFDNVNFPWAADLPTDMPTVGHRLRDLGYFSAYLGKWHLSAELDTTDVYGGPNPGFADVLDGYGFSDFVGPGDVIGMTLGGYRNDVVIGAITRRWLRLRAQDLADTGTPWFLAVNLVNPHDVMFFDTDLPGEAVQKSQPTMVPLSTAPRSPLYAATWDLPLPATRHEGWDPAERLSAHLEYQEGRRHMVGLIPDEDERWQRLQDYYLNCIRDSDRQIASVLDELDDQGFLNDAVVICTSDHGELGGAHGMSGKGATAYREQNNVPLIIKHPDLSGGSTCDALTSHLDLVPTIVGSTGSSDEGTQDLPGHDISTVLSSGGPTSVDAIRDATLYSFNMLLTVDGDFVGDIAALKAPGAVPGPPPSPDLSKRGAIRSVFDGRHRFTRYFAPTEHHRPETIDDLTERNDLELFDLDSDPGETTNLAQGAAKAEELVLQMNSLLNRLLDEEVGVDDGSFLPTGAETPWEIDRWDV